MADFELTVGGMACSGCVDSVKRAVEKAAPGAKVEIDLASGRVVVSGGADRDVVAGAITRAGYEIKG